MTDLETPTYKVSNSEAITWLTCQRRWYYQHARNLKPKKYGDALNRGIIGHEAMQIYYDAIKVGGSTEVAESMARSCLMSYYSQDSIVVTELLTIFDNYFAMQAPNDSDWIILGVEQKHEIDLGSGEPYVLRYDLLVQERSTNKVVIVDHKFVYDFWTADDLALSPQFPKYKAALRAIGINVDYCLLNQLRYRPIKPENWSLEKLFQRTGNYPSNAKMRNALQEQMTAARQIRQFKLLPLDQQLSQSVPCRNKVNCKNCSFKEPCASEFDGGDTDYLLSEFYEENTQYGYNNEVTADTERY